MSDLPVVWVDADACPFKEEIISIAKSFKLNINFVSNTPIKSLSGRKGIENLVTTADFDAVDHFMVENANLADFAVTRDLELAKRLLEKKVHVCGFLGKAYDKAQLAEAIGNRNLHTLMREEQGGFSDGAKKGKQVSKQEKISSFKNQFHNFLKKRLI